MEDCCTDMDSQEEADHSAPCMSLSRPGERGCNNLVRSFGVSVREERGWGNSFALGNTLVGTERNHQNVALGQPNVGNSRQR